MKKVETGASIQAAMNDGDYNTAFKLMKDSGTFPDRIGGVPFGLVVEQAGLEPHVVMGPTALSFGRKAALSFGREEMVAAEEMQRAFSSGNLKKLFEIINSTSIRPEKIGGEPFETALRSHGIDASRGIPGSAPKYLFYKAASGKYPSTDFFLFRALTLLLSFLFSSAHNPEQKSTVEQLEAALAHGDMETFVDTMWSSGLLPDKIGGVPFR